jgi:hypothetical protein
VTSPESIDLTGAADGSPPDDAADSTLVVGFCSNAAVFDATLEVVGSTCTWFGFFSLDPLSMFTTLL